MDIDTIGPRIRALEARVAALECVSDQSETAPVEAAPVAPEVAHEAPIIEPAAAVPPVTEAPAS